jgi:hypothetical protein
MYFTASKIYNSSNWNYLTISDDILSCRYGWVNIYFPSEDRKFAWAHEHNMVRLFLLCRTFPSKGKALKWIEDHLVSDLMPIHLSLIDKFCYSENRILESIDELIDQTNDNDLLNFIQIALDRSLLWHTPEPCWPSSFMGILRCTDEKLKKATSRQLKWVDTPEVEGVDFVSGENYTHVFYKFQNMINGIVKGELYYGIKDLSRQAHEVLLKSMELFFEQSNFSSLDEEAWERKLDEIANKETEWCKVQILNGRKK